MSTVGLNPGRDYRNQCRKLCSTFASTFTYSTRPSLSITKALASRDSSVNLLHIEICKMVFSYKSVLIIGGTSGIGWALAKRLLDKGSKVIVTGRREERLKAFTSENEGTSYYTVDITKLSTLPQFASRVVTEHPDIDCIILNSGIQRTHDFSKPETVDLTAIEQELTTNYLSYVHLVTIFTSHLQQQQSNPTALVFVSSGLGFVPAVRCLNYSATKAALHSFVLCLRVQLQNGPGDVRVVEIVPPAVQTELHNERNQPGLKMPKGIAMPLDQFINDAWEGLESGIDTVYVGATPKMAAQWESGRLEQFDKMAATLRQAQSK
jgi:short-subunit dehydrogenase involved in D-alanine esterification of teichoic acids